MNQALPQDSTLYPHRACPTCLERQDVAADVRADAPGESLSFPDLADRWRGFGTVSSFFSYGRCRTCGQLYAGRYVDEAKLSELYSSMGDNIHSGDAELAAQNQADYAEMILGGGARTARYLEIGPDTGLLTAAVHKRSPIERAFLIEPNRESWGKLRAALPEGVAVVAGDKADLDDQIEDGSLDLVVAIHVLDHLVTPSDMLAWLHRKLAPGGRIAMLVHNEGSALAKLFGARFPIYCLQHPQLYNRATLADALRRAGFTVDWVKPTPNTFRLGYLAQHGVMALTKVKLDLGALAWPVRLRLGNIMALGQKPQ